MRLNAGADHFSNTLFFDHQIALYENLVGFLGDECGPRGLTAILHRLGGRRSPAGSG